MMPLFTPRKETHKPSVYPYLMVEVRKRADYALRIVRQEPVAYTKEYTAKNGISIISAGYPAFSPGENIFYIRGRAQGRDLHWITVREDLLLDLLDAIQEFNYYLDGGDVDVLQRVTRSITQV